MARAPIPNIDIGQVYDLRYSDSEVHYEELGKLADFFGRNMPVHRHDRFFQVHYVKSGSVRVYLDEQLYHRQGPLFFLTPPTIPHAFDQLDETFAGEVARVDGLFELLREEFRGERPGRELALADLVRLIFVSLLRLSARSLKAQPMRREDLRLFQRFNQLIEQHYPEHWPLTAYAERIGVTEARLNDICRRVAGLPSKRLVHERLMQEARRLLLFSGSSVNEICYQLGFKDPAYFSRFFARNAGMAPGEYRQRRAGDKEEAWR